MIINTKKYPVLAKLVKIFLEVPTMLAKTERVFNKVCCLAECLKSV